VVILLAAIGWMSHFFVKRSMGEQLCTFSNNSFWLISVQLLDGVGAGIFGALMPLVIADLMRDTGRPCYWWSRSGKWASPGSLSGDELDGDLRRPATSQTVTVAQ
jgi:hypothetical protein